jgi:Arc/MetJ family transcription regulator
MTSDGARIDAYGWRLLPMRTTVNLDDELLRQAQQLSGIPERTQLLRAALQALVESARQRSGSGRSARDTAGGCA